MLLKKLMFINVVMYYKKFEEHIAEPSLCDVFNNDLPTSFPAHLFLFQRKPKQRCNCVKPQTHA